MLHNQLITNESIDTQLLDAAWNGNNDLIKKMIMLGANIDATTGIKATALHLVSVRGNIEIVKLLLDHRAKLEVACYGGYTALLAASEKGYADVIKLLLAAGANTEATDCYGDTALHIASRFGRAEVVKLLLKAGADPYVKNRLGETASIKAFQSGHPEISELLERVLEEKQVALSIIAFNQGAKDESHPIFPPKNILNEIYSYFLQSYLRTSDSKAKKEIFFKNVFNAYHSSMFFKYNRKNKAIEFSNENKKEEIKKPSSQNN